MGLDRIRTGPDTEDMKVFTPSTLLALAALLVPSVAQGAAGPSYTDLPSGDRAIVQPMPKQNSWVAEVVAQTLILDVDSRPLDPSKCPTGRVEISAEKKATMDKRWAEAGKEPRKLAGLFLPARPGNHCKIWLNARTLHRADDAQICNLVTHELGHARGLDHDAEEDFMRPTLKVLPTEPCDWAFSDWLDEE